MINPQNLPWFVALLTPLASTLLPDPGPSENSILSLATPPNQFHMSLPGRTAPL